MQTTQKSEKSLSAVIEVAYGDPCPAGLPVSTGVPFELGALKDTAGLAVRAPSGETRPAAGRVLARHADGSIRWCLVSFGARETGRCAEGRCASRRRRVDGGERPAAPDVVRDRPGRDR